MRPSGPLVRPEIRLDRRGELSGYEGFDPSVFDLPDSRRFRGQDMGDLPSSAIAASSNETADTHHHEALAGQERPVDVGVDSGEAVIIRSDP